jgi:hypothetical protein
MSEQIIDGFGLAAAVACALAAAGCVVMAASASDNNELLMFRQASSRRWAYRLFGLLMLITLENIVRHT